MDGSAALLDAHSGEVLHAVRAHTRYCVRVRWLQSGAGFLTAGREGAVACWACATGAGLVHESFRSTAMLLVHACLHARLMRPSA